MSDLSSTVMVSGGFDPIHRGHIALLRDAATHGVVVVALNSDAWLERKKGKVFQRWADRASVLDAIRYVGSVHPVDDSDGTVCDAIRQLRPAMFANGGDRVAINTPEVTLCEELGVTLLWGVGGGKIESSSELLSKWRG